MQINRYNSWVKTARIDETLKGMGKPRITITGKRRSYGDAYCERVVKKSLAAMCRYKILQPVGERWLMRNFSFTIAR
jgi:hypothetical protein